MERDYHRYFIQDGRHVGRYEEMYLNCPDPWHIESLGVRLDMKAALLLLAGQERSVNRFLDLGAGLGLFTGLLTEALWRENPAARGTVTDISPSAVGRAAKRLADPRLDFRALDARSLPESPAFPPETFDLVVMAQVLWGLLENLDEVLAALAGLLKPGGRLLVSQHFPGAERQSYGADIVSSPEDLARRLDRAGLAVVNTLETNRAANHHWAALARKKP